MKTFFLSIKKINSNISNSIKKYRFFKHLWIFLAFLPILGLFVISNPIESKYELLTDSNFDFQLQNIDQSNSPADIHYIKERRHFFIHPGTKPSIFTFTSQSKKKYKIKYWLKTTPAGSGNVLFTIKRNNRILKTSELTDSTHIDYVIPTKSGDIVSIEVDKNGTCSYDWTNFKLERQESNFISTMLFLIAWLVFIYSFSKRGLIFIATLSSITFTIATYAETVTFGELPINIAFIYLICSMGLGFIYLFIMKAFRENSLKLGSILSFIFFLLSITLPSIIVLHWLQFHHIFTDDAFIAVIQTNLPETIEFILANVPVFFIITAFVLLIAFLYLFIQQETYINVSLGKKKSFVIFFFVFFSIGVFIPETRTANFLYSVYDKYFAELKEYQLVQEQRKAGNFSYKASKTETGETYIFVIGESLNKDHMGLYGYCRNTTPKLSSLKDSNELQIFNNAFSNHTHTVQVIQLALTEANQQNGKSFFQSPSIVNILNAADFETYWISNQVRFGGFDNIVTLIADDSKFKYHLNKNTGQTVESEYDEIVLPQLKDVLSQKTSKNRAIFIHLMGSHQDYNTRYPNNFNKFSGILSAKDYGIPNDLDRPMINLYDNSVLYNDSIVHNIILQAKQYGGVSSVVYFSDHADDVFKNIGHNASAFTYAMTRIPFFVWLSPDYQKRYSKKTAQIHKHLDADFCNDMMYDFMVGLTSVKTPNYNPVYDISDSLYSLPSDKLFTLHGKVKYVRCLTKFYWQDSTQVQWIK